MYTKEDASDILAIILRSGDPDESRRMLEIALNTAALKGAKDALMNVGRFAMITVQEIDDAVATVLSATADDEVTIPGGEAAR